MNARTILGAFAAIVVALSAVGAGALIWVVTARPELLASASGGQGMTGLALAAAGRLLKIL